MSILRLCLFVFDDLADIKSSCSCHLKNLSIWQFSRSVAFLSNTNLIGASINLCISLYHVYYTSFFYLSSLHLASVNLSTPQNSRIDFSVNAYVNLFCVSRFIPIREGLFSYLVTVCLFDFCLI